MGFRFLADVGALSMIIPVVACLLAISMFALQGCSGEVTPEMQKAKKDALQKVADDHKNEVPNREDRGSR
jgi:hypothetical protein